ncbi:hypothetical protein BJX64DRAFT_41406 [Aspergillus heterothallicus]
MGQLQLQFIAAGPNLGDQSTGSKPKKNVARSHAARATHAKARIQQTMRYQQQKAAQRRLEGGSAEAHAYYLPSPLTGLLTDLATIWIGNARQLSSLEQMLFNHYVTTVIPSMTCNFVDSQFYRKVTSVWVPFALGDIALANLLLLSSCRHLSLMSHASEQQQHYSRLACQYKLGVLRSLREAISIEVPWFSDSTIAATIMLAHDDLSEQEETTSKQHVEGAARMVALRGGSQTLGLDGLLERLLFTARARLGDAVAASIESVHDSRIASFEIGDECHSSLRGNQVLFEQRYTVE